MNNKICKICKKEKPLCEFSLRKDRNNIPRTECKECLAIRSLARRRNNLIKHRYALKREIKCQVY